MSICILNIRYNSKSTRLILQIGIYISYGEAKATSYRRREFDLNPA